MGQEAETQTTQAEGTPSTKAQRRGKQAEATTGVSEQWCKMRGRGLGDVAGEGDSSLIIESPTKLYNSSDFTLTAVQSHCKVLREGAVESQSTLTGRDMKSHLVQSSFFTKKPKLGEGKQRGQDPWAKMVKTQVC